MKNLSNTFKIVIAVVVVIIAFTIIQRVITPEYITTTKTVTTIDSTKVDSLQKEIEYLESIDPDTTYITLRIPTPTQNGDSLTYTFPYSDSLLVSQWTVTALGQITEADFEYYYRARYVREKETIITETIKITKLQQITKTKQPRAYLSAGLEVGVNPQFNSVSPKISYTMQDGQTFSFRYDVINQGYYVSYTRPIRFRLPF